MDVTPMNDQSFCARWRSEAWECSLNDALIDPAYFSPATHAHPILHVLAFHRDYPQGRAFERIALGERWVRVS
jgi:hypothetical protein